MPLTEQQRADLQSDLGIGADESVFTDAQLDRLQEDAAPRAHSCALDAAAYGAGQSFDLAKCRLARGRDVG